MYRPLVLGGKLCVCVCTVYRNRWVVEIETEFPQLADYAPIVVSQFQALNLWHSCQVSGTAERFVARGKG